MAIEFKHNGRIWRADTVDEAVALRQCLEAEDQAHIEIGEEPSVVEEQVWTPDTVMGLLKSAGRRQKEFLRLLYGKAEVTDDEAVKKLELDSEASFAGVLSGLSKQLKKLGMKPWELYSTSVQWSKEGKTRSFRLSPRFKWVAVELGWPEKWI